MILFYKNEGETPLESIGRLRVERPDIVGEKMTYAGRLDPMASGVLPILVGEECKEKEKYTGCNKEYEAEVLFGCATDTGDILGLVTEVKEVKKFSQDEIGKVLLGCVGKQMQTYPAYSSKTVDGRALHEIARAGEIDDIEIPTREIEIYSIDYLGMKEISGEALLSQMTERIQKVNGDFRQQEIFACWQKNLADKKEKTFQIVQIKVKCSSGTYIRTLAENIGKKLGALALAWKIVRTQIFLEK